MNLTEQTYAAYMQILLGILKDHELSAADVVVATQAADFLRRRRALDTIELPPTPDGHTICAGDIFTALRAYIKAGHPCFKQAPRANGSSPRPGGPASCRRPTPDQALAPRGSSNGPGPA